MKLSTLRHIVDTLEERGVQEVTLNAYDHHTCRPQLVTVIGAVDHGEGKRSSYLIKAAGDEVTLTSSDSYERKLE